ncbi:MAG: hypothetical protein SGI86_11170 [Deltaproteobacteria bacterium]|nr:hypothetical protein [Deltaproteobacteria bacterium]
MLPILIGHSFGALHSGADRALALTLGTTCRNLSQMALARSLLDLVDENRSSQPTDAERVRTIWNLYSAGMSMTRMRFRREHPEENDEQIETRISNWLKRSDWPTDPGFRKRELPIV